MSRKGSSSVRLVEIAELLGVSKQRAHQIADESGFPSPLAEDARGRRFYRRVWVPAVHAAELTPFTPHGLRHTAVALAIATGAHPKQIQELCRHRSITTTLNEYGGLFESLHEGLADSLEAAIQASRAGQMRDEGGTRVLELRR